MMGHGTHCDCMMCTIGKSVGMIKKCEDKTCTHPEHKKDKDNQDRK